MCCASSNVEKSIPLCPENKCTGGAPWPPLLENRFFARIASGAKRGGHGDPPYIDFQAD